MADDGLPTTYALIYNFLKKRSHAKAAAAVKKAAKEASVVILKDSPEGSEQDDLNQIVKAWKAEKLKRSTKTSSSEDDDSGTESSSQSDSSDTDSSSGSNSKNKPSHAAKVNGKISTKSKTNASSEKPEGSDSNSSSQSSSESEMEQKPGIGAKRKVNAKPTAQKSPSPSKPKGHPSSDRDSSDSTSSDESSTSDSKSSSSDSKPKSKKKKDSKKSEADTPNVKITKKRRLSDSGQAKVTAVDGDSKTPLKTSKQNGKLQANDNNGNATMTPVINRGGDKKPRKSNTPFQRIKSEDVVFADDRLKDNTYMARGGAANDYGARANQDLIVTRGDSFRKAKNKKKRGSYRGGEITLQSHSIKFT